MYLLQTASARHPPCFMQAKPESARGEWKSGTFAKTPFPPDGWYVDYSWVDWAGDDRCTTCSLPPRALRHPSRAVPLVPTTRWSAHIKRTELYESLTVWRRVRWRWRTVIGVARNDPTGTSMHSVRSRTVGVLRQDRTWMGQHICATALKTDAFRGFAQ